MTPAQREIAELLRDLQRPPELIAINAGLPLPTIRAWLRSGKWPKSRPTQRTLFDATGEEIRSEPTTKPATTASGHGLSLFSNPTGKSEITQATRSGVTP